MEVGGQEGAFGGNEGTFGGRVGELESALRGGRVGVCIGRN
jgi:hypothetical protein